MIYSHITAIELFLHIIVIYFVYLFVYFFNIFFLFLFLYFACNFIFSNILKINKQLIGIIEIFSLSSFHFCKML